MKKQFAATSCLTLALCGLSPTNTMGFDSHLNLSKVNSELTCKLNRNRSDSRDLHFLGINISKNKVWVMGEKNQPEALEYKLFISSTPDDEGGSGSYEILIPLVDQVGIGYIDGYFKDMAKINFASIDINGLITNQELNYYDCETTN